MKSDFICLYCGQPTTDDSKDRTKLFSTRDHVIPESIGGKRKLPQGDVCEGCNKKFGETIDKKMRDNPILAATYQMDDSIRGKKRSKAQRKQKANQLAAGVHPKQIIEADGYLTRCETVKGNKSIEFRNCPWFSDWATKDFLRGVHKIAANVFCMKWGSRNVRKNFPELIQFVRGHGSEENWGVAFAWMPRCKFLWEFLCYEEDIDGIGIPGALILHNSGIWLAGSVPNLISPANIELLSTKIRQYSNDAVPVGIQLPVQKPIGYHNFYTVYKPINILDENSVCNKNGRDFSGPADVLVACPTCS